MNKIIAAGALGSALILGQGGPPVSAEDYGDWDASWCGDRAEACMWMRDPFNSKLLSSNTRDSYFKDNWYLPPASSPGLNDEVRFITNKFTTKEVRGFRDYDYARALSCVTPNNSFGPYTLDSPDGVSSFKSC